MLWRAMTAVRDQTRLHGIILILVRYRFGGIVLRMGLAVSLMCFAAAPTWLIAPPAKLRAQGRRSCSISPNRRRKGIGRTSSGSE